MEKIIVSCLESRVEADRSIYARFLLGPFTDDHAVTIATALRRALLSKVKNTGITAIHIQGISHEFSTIAGVRESVLDLALNFQQIVFRTQIESQREMFRTRKGLPRFLHVLTRTQQKEQRTSSSYSTTSHKKMNKRSTFQNQSREADLLSQFKKYGNTKFTPKDKRLHLCNKMGDHLYTESSVKDLSKLRFDDLLSETTQIGYLQIRGPAVIYANDLKLPVGIECVDPTQYIATLSAEGLLVVKFLIGKKKVFLYPAGTELYKNEVFVRCLQKQGFCSASLRENDTLTGTKLNSSKRKLVRTKNSFLYKNLSKLRFDQLFANKTQPFLKSRLSEESFKFIQSDPRIQKQDTKNHDQTKVDFNEDNSNVLPFRSSGKVSSTKYLRNTIFLDPILDSVYQVNYIIEKDDLSNQPRERIVLELWTNGSVHPRQAIHQASLSLMSTFSIFRKMFHAYSW